MENKLDLNQDLFREEDIRKEKIKALKANGINPYADKFDCTDSISEARKEPIGKVIRVAGRIILKRVMGKFAFVKIRDVFDFLQISFGRNELSEQDYNFFRKQIDVGDFVGVEGELYITQTGELTVRTHSFQLLSKAQKPLPEKFHGLSDTEAKYRERYLDLICNEQKCKFPIIEDYRLNERHYGALQGLNKAETAKKYGDEQVHLWRRSATERPPLLSKDDPRNPKFDPLYAGINAKLPVGESLIDTGKRVKQCFDDAIKPKLQNGSVALIVAHGNSLRALIQILDKIDNDKISSL